MRRAPLVPVALLLIIVLIATKSLWYQSTPYIKPHPSNLQLRLLERVHHGPLEPRYAGMVEAMALGWRGNLEPEIKTAFLNSGIMHLLCVSGLHVGLVAALTGALLFWVSRERRGRLIRGAVQLVVLWGFALLTGGAPSTLRAALMFSLFIVSDLLGFRTERLNLLAAVAIVMLSVKPSLLFHVGWQLSFAAVGGILLVRPLLDNFRHNILIQSAIVSTAATLATLPIIVSVFHHLPVYFLVANLLIVPWASIILAGSLLYVAIPCSLTAALVRPPLWITDRVTQWIASLPYATVEGIDLEPWALLLLTVAVILLLTAPRLIPLGNQKQ